MSELLELAERCEKATGPDRDLSERIYAEINGWSFPLFGSALQDFLDQTKEHGLTNFTQSIDAAMTLVPEGHAVSVEWSPRFPGNAWIYPPNNWNDISFYGEANSPALALCAATLRARAATPSIGSVE